MLVWSNYYNCNNNNNNNTNNNNNRSISHNKGHNRQQATTQVVVVYKKHYRFHNNWNTYKISSFLVRFYLFVLVIATCTIRMSRAHNKLSLFSTSAKSHYSSASVAKGNNILRNNRYNTHNHINNNINHRMDQSSKSRTSSLFLNSCCFQSSRTGSTICTTIEFSTRLTKINHKNFAPLASQDTRIDNNTNNNSVRLYSKSATQHSNNNHNKNKNLTAELQRKEEILARLMPTHDENGKEYSLYERCVRRLYLTNLFHPVKMGLQNIHQLNALLGKPLDDVDKVTVIHVAGTNGKGSVFYKLAKKLELADVSIFISFVRQIEHFVTIILYFEMIYILRTNTAK